MFSMKSTNDDCINHMRLWYKVWLLDGNRVIRAENKTAQDTMRKVCSDSHLQKGNLEWFTLTIHWGPQKLAKICRGITPNPPHIDPKQMYSPDAQPEQSKNGLNMRLRRGVRSSKFPFTRCFPSGVCQTYAWCDTQASTSLNGVPHIRLRRGLNKFPFKKCFPRERVSDSRLSHCSGTMRASTCASSFAGRLRRRRL